MLLENHHVAAVRKPMRKWEMKMHRRIIDISADDKAIRQLMRLKIPDDVYIELSLT